MNGWRTGSQCAQVNSKRGGGTSPETFLKRESVEWGTRFSKTLCVELRSDWCLPACRNEASVANMGANKRHDRTLLEPKKLDLVPALP